MAKFQYTKENEEKFQITAKKYPKIDAMLLPALWLVQEQEGWVSPEAMIFVADKIGKQPIEVYEFATFYTMFNLKPIGTYHIELCKTLSCMLMGANNLKKFIKDTIGIEPGQTSADGKFHLSEVECLGACGGAPMFALNGQYHENQTVESLKNLIEECK
ncbi:MULTISPECIES: NAD(P)H-dependent oxidoreductase subunit E [Arcobacter]|jgi:NADH-quinone oxidoreductase subunit E|uniref:NADH-quinone oxidoreductase, E subunit n=1 Tax=Arcobacter nitrofigilis (strain ATCC 33309 / DSM 7299 / CCUG 15893 / LMG 7604 / NCTC 12251 / CI) TaxID=572480 RepID=D5V6N3_ARCNC|nr:MULTISPECIES: NAD(P)H-dependent oxidoreductase subunit E [Arcobacter]ADG94303.1 NADH-quinone oxidoreductase, E subunit [Arcobacter nitrofigilis DSM 7299]RXJ82452.1 NAD(P)H-dependent oxidoreductase subunit E [Arcobacter sp. F2176]|tara:strand:+ start:4132 stop:4608 length:477 start_codon:yes stop_codon:yes gene_type:complete